MRPARFLLLISLPLAMLSCQSTGPEPTTKTSIAQPSVAQPSVADADLSEQVLPQRFENAALGLRLLYPAGWKLISTDPTQFRFVQENNATPLELTLDVPKLPWHPAFLLTADAVRDGFISHAKQAMPDQQLTKLPDEPIPDARNHRIKLTGTVHARPVINEAVLIVHDDRVYVLSIETGSATYAPLHQALDMAVASLKWIKPVPMKTTQPSATTKTREKPDK